MKKPVDKMGAPLVVEKGVPLPPKNSILEGGITETIRDMDVGDSFVIPRARRGQVLNVADRIGVSVATRSISEVDVRVWKTGIDRHDEKLVARREQSRKQPIGYKQPPPPRITTPSPIVKAAVPALPPLPTPLPAGSTAPLEPLQAAAICKEAGVNVNRFSPILLEWKARGVTERKLREAIDLGARSTTALDEVFRGVA